MGRTITAVVGHNDYLHINATLNYNNSTTNKCINRVIIPAVCKEHTKECQTMYKQ